MNRPQRRWKTWFLIGWASLIVLAGLFTFFSWLVSWIEPAMGRITFMPAVLWFLCLIRLAVFLEDSGIPLAILIAGLVWWIYTSFEIQLDAGVPEIVAGGCLLGGTAGGLLGGIVRKVNASSQKISLMLTAMGSLLGFILGYGLLAVFAGLMWV